MNFDLESPNESPSAVELLDKTLLNLRHNNKLRVEMNKKLDLLLARWLKIDAKNGVDISDYDCRLKRINEETIAKLAALELERLTTNS